MSAARSSCVDSVSQSSKLSEQLDGNHELLLFQASYEGDLELVKSLLDPGPAPKVNAHSWAKALVIAIEHQQLEIANAILDTGEVDVLYGFNPKMPISVYEACKLEVLRCEAFGLIEQEPQMRNSPTYTPEVRTQYFGLMKRIEARVRITANGK